MIINQEHLDSIYEVLADKIRNDDIVSAYLEKFPAATRFQYRGDKPSFSNIYYLTPELDKGVKLIELSSVSCDSEFLDRVLQEAEFLITKAREDRQVLDFYLEKIRNL